MRGTGWVITLVLLLCALGGVPQASAAAQQVDRVADAGNRINLAGRQRMLSQRMAKAACLRMRGIDAARQGEVAEAASLDFERVLIALRDGAPDLGLLPEREDDLTRAYDDMVTFSAPFTASAKQIAHDDLHTLVVELLVWRNLPVLTRMNDTVGVIEARYADGTIDPGRAAAINLAGRKRMLSQKMVKELCFLSIGLGGAEVRADLGRTVEVFDESIKALFRGGSDGSLGEKPSAQLRRQLRALRNSWKPMKSLLERVVEGGPITDEVLEEALAQGEALLQEANALTLLYARG